MLGTPDARPGHRAAPHLALVESERGDEDAHHDRRDDEAGEPEDLDATEERDEREQRMAMAVRADDARPDDVIRERRDDDDAVDDEQERAHRMSVHQDVSGDRYPDDCGTDDGKKRGERRDDGPRDGL